MSDYNLFAWRRSGRYWAVLRLGSLGRGAQQATTPRCAVQFTHLLCYCSKVTAVPFLMLLLQMSGQETTNCYNNTQHRCVFSYNISTQTAKIRKCDRLAKHASQPAPHILSQDDEDKPASECCSLVCRAEAAAISRQHQSAPPAQYPIRVYISACFAFSTLAWLESLCRDYV